MRIIHHLISIKHRLFGVRVLSLSFSFSFFSSFLHLLETGKVKIPFPKRACPYFGKRDLRTVGVGTHMRTFARAVGTHAHAPDPKPPFIQLPCLTMFFLFVLSYAEDYLSAIRDCTTELPGVGLRCVRLTRTECVLTGARG